MLQVFRGTAGSIGFREVSYIFQVRVTLAIALRKCIAYLGHYTAPGVVSFKAPLAAMM